MVVPGSCRLGVAAGMAALQIFYNLATGLWKTTEWWNAANALETTIDYSTLTDTLTYRGDIFNTFEKYKGRNFLSPWFFDDEGWWALTWIKAYDLTGETRYLDMAKTIFNDMKGGWDSTCGGGLWWKKLKQQRTYKNAITNELFLSVAARLHLRSPKDSGPGSYLDWAQREWNWFKHTGLINSSDLVNDGLNNSCQNNGQTTWTYNQGVILSGLVDLYKSTNDSSLLDQAQAIANATIRTLAPKGILQEPCRLNGTVVVAPATALNQADCGDEGAQFKGIFMRNLYYLYRTTQQQTYKDFITQNADSIWSHRNRAHQFGFSWAGSFDGTDAVRQSAAMDTINAAILLGTKGITYQAGNGTLHHLSKTAIHNGDRRRVDVAAWNHDQQWVFNVNVGCSGKYKLIFRYAAAGNASRYIYVNGRSIVRNQLFPHTGSWSHWHNVTVPEVWLNAGSNTVSVSFNSSKGSRNWLNLDEMTVE